VGVVVTHEDYFEKFYLFTIDDSSGATIEVNCRKPQPQLQTTNTTTSNDTPTTQDASLLELASSVGALSIGTVVQVKGTLSMFRSTRQLQLERITVVRDTAHEMRLIAARTKTLDEVLREPWLVSASTQKRLRKEAHGEAENEQARTSKHRQRQAMRQAREKRHADEISKAYVREEHEREKAADVAREAGKLLKESTST